MSWQDMKRSHSQQKGALRLKLAQDQPACGSANSLAGRKLAFFARVAAVPFG